MTSEELEARLKAAETKADKAAEVALAAIAVQKNLHAALEKSHEQMGEMLAASKQMAKLAESLANHVLAPPAPAPALPRTGTPAPSIP